MLCTFDNNTNKQSYLYISNDTFERHISGIGEQKPILEFESDIKVNLKNNYDEFSIGDDKLIFNTEHYIHEYIHNGYKYIIPSNIFNKVLATCYRNKLTIKYNTYYNHPYQDIKYASERDNTLMINILNKYGYIPNEPFVIDERWFTQLLDFNK